MTKTIRTLALPLLLTALPAMADSLPADILRQIPRGYKVLSVASGELDDDKLPDYAVALSRDNEGMAARTGRAPARPLLLFIARADGGYTLARRNDHVVFRSDEGGQCDPFEDGVEGLVIKSRYFTVQNSVACGQHWSDYITFRYAPELRDWLFHKRIGESWVMNPSSDPNADALIPGGRSVVSGKGKPPVLFEKYRAN